MPLNPVNQPDDTPRLVQNALSGDKSSYGRLMHDYMPLACGLAYARASDPAAARQKALDFFAKAHPNLWQASRDNFARWVYVQFSHTESDEQPSDAAATGNPRETQAVYLFTGDIDRTSRIQKLKVEQVRRNIAGIAPDDEGGKPCRKRNLLPLMLNEDIPQRTRELMGIHLAGCEQCRRTLDSMRVKLDRLKHDLHATLPDAQAIDEVVAALPDDPPKPPAQPLPVLMISYAWLFTALLLLVAFLLYLLNGPK